MPSRSRQPDPHKPPSALWPPCPPGKPLPRSPAQGVGPGVDGPKAAAGSGKGLGPTSGPGSAVLPVSGREGLGDSCSLACVTASLPRSGWQPWKRPRKAQGPGGLHLPALTTCELCKRPESLRPACGCDTQHRAGAWHASVVIATACRAIPDRHPSHRSRSRPEAGRSGRLGNNGNSSSGGCD